VRCCAVLQSAPFPSILLNSAVVLLLRTYALWGRNLLVLVLIGTVGLGIPGIGIVGLPLHELASCLTGASKWSIVPTSCVNTFDTSVASQLKL
jgi:hypothetical protein